MESQAGGPLCALLLDSLQEFPLGQVFTFQAPDASSLRAQAGIAGGVAQLRREAASSEPCPHCGLPVGDFGYAGTGGGLLHGECQAQLVLQKARAEEQARTERDAALKQKHRAEFGIGWRPWLGTRRTCSVTLGNEGSATLAPTDRSDAAVDVEFLAVALEVRRREGKEALFSLDPRHDIVGVEEGRAARWQVKRFEPSWLEGTGVGELLFQADYHLKELSMGEHEQPVVGMKSCLDLASGDEQQGGWYAREWFVVRRAELQLEADGIVVPRVEMGVEAREMIRGPNGLEDAPITKSEHPLVQYAAAFTQHFDLIAERRSVFYHLRELAKASVLAKFLLENCPDLDESWFHFADEVKERTPKMIPQLWNERSHSQVCVRDGEIIDTGTLTGTSVHGVYGGVRLSLEGLNVSKKTLQPASIPSTFFPKGVDLNLDAFEASALTRSAESSSTLSRGNKFAAGGEPLCRDQFMNGLFNPNLSDRCSEGGSLASPSTPPAYLRKLHGLMRGEEAIREQRRHHFFSANFSMDQPGPLFPPSWTPPSSFGISPGGAAPTAHPLDQSLCSRPDLRAGALFYIWQAAQPTFDRVAEDGERFRIYRVGALEFRTVQEPGGTESPGAAFCHTTTSASGDGEGLAEALQAGVSRVVQYVEAAGQAPQPHFYVVLETDRGHCVMAEKLAAGAAAVWAASTPEVVEARRAVAKVIRAAECRGGNTTLEELQRQAAGIPAHSGSREYARRLLDLAHSAGTGAPSTTRAALQDCGDVNDYSDLNYAI